MMKFFIETIRESAISPYTNMIATVFLALSMGMAMAQEADNLSLSPANQDVTAEAGSTDFTVTTNIPAADLTVTADTWTEATAAAGWSARNSHASVVFGGKMWVIGGFDGSHQDDVWSSTDGMTWTQVTTTGTIWSGRWGHTSVVFDNKMWVIGGNDGSLQNDVWHSTDGITWTEATAAAGWSARSGHTSVVFGGKMWVIGGNDGSPNQDDVWSSTDGATWTQATADAAWSARRLHTSVVFGGKMWVIGGNDGSRQNDVWNSTDGMTWTQVATTGTTWSARDSHTSVVFDNKMWVIGGDSGSDQFADVWNSTDGITWTEATANAAWSGRSSHTSVVFGGKMWVIGGFDGSNQDDVYFSEEWLAASLSGTTLTADYEANGIFNAPRTGTVTISGSGLTAMATVTQAGIVPDLALSANQDVTAAAGSTDFTVTTNIPSGDLTVSANTWTEATSATGWSARDGHTSVAFDGKMWVIGGIDDSFSQNNVWSSTDGITWTQATANAAWSGRENHASVVFDNKMWVIGGNGNFGLNQNDVWHSTDGMTWTQATDDTPWSARSGHASVVFGGKMWVIGGTDGSFSSLADVWSSTDGITWTQATTNAAWAGRQNHASVVFDNKMWVIGGTDGSFSSLADVWSSTDGITWTQATTNAAWSARHDHTSVVFDNRMWVIGGWDGFNWDDDVWSSTDGITWTQTTANAAWSARNDHTSVVFDNKMWVIGGTDASDRQNDVYFSEEWLAASLSGTTLTADYEANGFVTPRTGTVIISGIGLTATATVTQAGAVPALALSPANQDVTAETGSTNFTVTTNLPSGDLTITDDADWLTFNLSGSDFPYTLTADYEVNSIAAPRTVTVTVSGGGLTETVTVTQAGATPELALSPATQDVSAETGSTNFTVTTNVPSGDLTITDDADWLTVSLSGTTLTVDYEANGMAAPRTGTVTVSGGGLTEMVTVTQAGAAPELGLSPAMQSVTAEAGSTNFTVTTNVPSGDLTITDDADWLTVSLSGTTLTADYEANSDIGHRTGTVTVSGGGLAQTVTVVQAETGVTFELALSPAVQNVTAEAGSTDFMLTTNLPSDAFIITDDADWLTVSLSGTTLTADYEANGIADPRIGTVTVSGGGLTEMVTVTQAGAAPELALSPANRDVSAETGSTNFTVTTNVPSGDLTITDDADWLTVSLSGTTLTADYEANGIVDVPRTGTVTVSGLALTETVTVTQAGAAPELALSPATQSVTSEAGSTNFTVTTNMPSGDLTTTDDADWLTVSLSGTTLTADYEANSSTNPRTGIVTVSGGGLTRTVTVVQAETGVTFELALSPATQSVTAEAGSTSFTVTTNLPSDALTPSPTDADWLTVSLSGTSSPYILTADYEANEGTDPRTGIITVLGGGLTETVTVTQAQEGLVFELTLSPAVQSVTNEAGTTDFTVTTNLPADALTTTDDADWLTVSLSGSSSPYPLTATYEANEGADPRTGTVTVSGGGLTRTVTVEQEAAPLGLADETILVIYPNPGVAQVTVDFGDMAQGEGKEWMLFDPSGRKALSGSVARGEATLVIPTQGLLSGLYLFQVRGEGQKSYVSHRVVIRH